MKNSIKNKLVTGFCLCVVSTSAIVWFFFSSFHILEKRYFETVQNSMEMELATDAQHIGEDMYMIIANAMFGGNLAKIDQEWVESKRKHTADLQKLSEAVDTAEDHARVKEAREAFENIIHIFEQEMLPLIRKGGGLNEELREIDARIDLQVEAIKQSLKSVSRTLSNDNRTSFGEFQRVLNNTTRFVMIISIVALFVVLLLSFLITRWIIRPLSELTTAARIMETGDFNFHLKHRSADEIGLLVNTFQHMSDQVAKRTDELQDLNKELLHEVSERKQTEEIVLRLNEELESRVEERTAELVRANEQLTKMIETQQQTEKELTTSREELRNLSQHLQNIREEERTSIAREVHDELGQLLTALKMDLSWLKSKLPGDNRQLTSRTRDMDQLLDETIKTVQRISAELRPGILDDLGLGSAIDWQAKEFQKRTGINCSVDHNFDFTGLDRGRSTTLFRIVQESLTNIYRHSGATRARITLAESDNVLVASILDNGKGITQKQLTDPSSLGLIGMRERIRYYGGTVTIDNLPDGGTSVRINIPLNNETGKEQEHDASTYSG